MLPNDADIDEARPVRVRRPRLTPPQIELLTDIVTKPQMFLRRWSRWSKTGGCLAGYGYATLSSEGPSHVACRATRDGRLEAVRRGLIPAREVVTLTHGDERFTDLLYLIRDDPALQNAMWADAESSPWELAEPGTRWSIALDAGQPAAWCAARELPDGTLKCHSNYEVDAFRGEGLYEAAYRARHDAVVAPAGRPAVTYLFEQPIALHEADGWQRTGLTGEGEVAGHTWWELRRG